VELEPGPADTVAAPKAARAVVTMRLLAPDATGIPVRCVLRYEPADPYAVHLVFHTDGPEGEAIHWSFARDLLAAGLSTPSGVGDVRVWPWTTLAGESIALALSSPDGQAVLEAPREPVSRFLDVAYAAVPAGAESRHLGDLEAWFRGGGGQGAPSGR
jgi:hypothetical protein